MDARYAQLREAYQTMSTGHGRACVLDDGGHTCTTSCVHRHVPGRCYVTKEGDEVCRVRGCRVRPGERVVCDLDDLYVCASSMKAHICTEETCTYTESTSDGRVCVLTGRILESEPTYSRGARRARAMTARSGWMDDPWRPPAPSFVEARGCARSPVIETVQALLRWHACGEDKGREEIARAKADTCRYVTTGLRGRQEEYIARALALAIKRGAQLARKSSLARQPVFMDEMYTRMSQRLPVDVPCATWMDESHFDEVMRVYLAGCVDYLIVLGEQAEWPVQDIPLRHAVTTLLYMHLRPITIEGVAVTTGDDLLRALLPPYHMLPLFLGSPMATYTCIETTLRALIKTALAQYGADLTRLRFASVLATPGTDRAVARAGH